MADETNGSTSDGFHTFDELYHHRTILFLLLCVTAQKVTPPPGALAWKSWAHADDTMFDGFFIAGLDTPFGAATYHIREEYWDSFPLHARLRAPEFDGHTPADVLDRLCKTIIGTEVRVEHG